LPSGFVAHKFVAALDQQSWCHIGKRIMPELGLLPLKPVALLVRSRWAFAGQNIVEVPVNEVAHRVASCRCGREVPTFKQSAFTDFCPFTDLSEGLKAG
jgi:hypothetical protein